MLLFAAGETISMIDVVIPDYLELETENTLMNICRTSVRTHLLVVSRMNMFVRVPRLGLPKLLAVFFTVRYETLGAAQADEMHPDGNTLSSDLPLKKIHSGCRLEFFSKFISEFSHQSTTKIFLIDNHYKTTD